MTGRGIATKRASAPQLTRRTFVGGLAVGAAAASLGTLRGEALPASPQRAGEAILSGSEFDLTIGEVRVNFTGKSRRAVAINGSVPGPTLRWREGDTVTLRVRNTLDEETSLHWHGILLPANMDGVPGLSFHGIHPGETFTYRFKVRQNGTYWYHSHSRFQEQLGTYGSLVIEPRQPEPFEYQREHTIVMSDWTDENPEGVLSKLKKQSDYYNRRQRTVADFLGDVRSRGLGTTLSERAMWGEMRMSDRDLADVTGSTYTYLINGQPPAANWTGLFQSGERVRLRFINASAMTYFDVRIPGVKMTVVAADGQHVNPVAVDEFRIAVAETYDVLVEPSGREAFTIFAQAMDRTGYAAGTLALHKGLRAETPRLDPRPSLSMDDIGHDMGQAVSTISAISTMTAPGSPDPHAGHDMSKMGSHDLAHPGSEHRNPLVDMQAITPTSKLDDPGVGLRNNGRRVLTYADLKSAFPDPDGREPARTIELHLTGHMGKFVWTFDGVKASDAGPIHLTYGERVRFVLVNDTMMTHPIHLHGMWSDIEDEDGKFHLRKHVVNMPPGSKRSFRVTADALGRWAFHCHLLYHMTAGMFREVKVEEGDLP